MRWLLLLLPSAIALFYLEGIPRSFEFGKILLLRAGLFTVLLGSLIQLFRHKQLKLYVERFRSPLAILIFLMLGWIFIATVVSPQRLHSIFGNYERAFGLVQWLTLGGVFTLFLHYLTPKHFKKGLQILLWVGALIGLYAIVQRLGWDPLFSTYNTDFLEGRVFATAGNPDFLAQFLSPLVFLALFFFWKDRSWRHLTLALPMFLGMVFTETRGAFLALAFGLAVFAFLIIKKRKQVLAGLAALSLLFLLGVQFQLPLFERFQLNATNFRSLESRFLTWESADWIIWEHPFFGLGPDNLELHFPEYLNHEIYEHEDDLNLYMDRAHNEFLEMGLIGGVPLMALYLALIGLLLHGLTQEKKKSLQFGLTMALLIHFLQNQLSFALVTHMVLMLYLLAGLIIMSTPQKTLTWKPTTLFRYAGIPLTAVFVLCAIQYSMIRPLQAELWYTEALANPQNSYTALHHAIGFAPTQSKFHYALLMSYPETANQEIPLLKLIEGDTMNILTWEATALSTTNEPERAYTLFEELIARNPGYPHTRRSYADALYRNGDYADAASHYYAYLAHVPDFWTWCGDLDSHSAYEQKKYRIFYKNVPDFNNALYHLQESLTLSGQSDPELDEQIVCLEG